MARVFYDGYSGSLAKFKSVPKLEHEKTVQRRSSLLTVYSAMQLFVVVII